ncbi:trichodiene oxygenase [Eremomyces bilateralis CBS 781.70]|uniref:Trichodiene oxygenase n=1 Tax=Eremomyces bilateralis CBS 781.70 TaxID=1392243 RepID=A0A6G1FZJ9_9PEZI|nr:trichodiene oxygenase [Eremomyces bilateralis CBS 781.70]KAF1811223.1 trichodiene oxygenase [Eremomyces bilateralis CBS 781.70]
MAGLAAVLKGELNGSWTPIIGGIVTFLVVYYVGVAIYRLFLSPLAKFPGPKFAGLTRWYEGYYEIIKSGSYSRRIDRMHDEYGPIVRVAPDEIHIRDPDFWDDVYSKNPKIQVAKIGWDTRFGSKASTFTTPDATKHRQRRAAFSNMFSKRAILQLEPVIRDTASTLIRRMVEFAESKKVLNVREAYSAYTGDIIMQYSFGFCYNQLETPNFDSFHYAFKAIGGMGHIAAQWPWVLPLMNSLPDWLVQILEPASAELLRLKRDQWDLVGRTIRGEELKVSHRTIFNEIVESQLPPEDKSQQRLADEAQTTVGAGVETTANTLSIATFHISNTPSIYEKLHKELVEAFPDRTVVPSLYDFEKLPYLRACIQEGLRLGYGLSARNPRAHDRPLRYNDWVIPAHTTVAMTIVDLHHDEKIFPQSHSYIPERWLNNPVASTGKALDHYLVPFGRGPRMCMGINLAWAELHYCLGTVFRQFKFDLFETDVTDVKMAHDFFIPFVKFDSKGVRVTVSETKD